MSLKHSLVSAAAQESESKRPRHDGVCDLFLGLPEDCRLRILAHLTCDDLADVAQVSRQFCKDCSHPSLPQMRTVYIRCGATFMGCRVHGPLFLFRKLVEMQLSGRLQHFQKLKLVGHCELGAVTTKLVRQTTKKLILDSLTVLDLSAPASLRKNQLKLKASIPKGLAGMMPNLREVDLSCTLVAQAALTDFAKKCPLLEKITWHSHQTAAFVTGQDLKACRNLKEIHMDNSEFYGCTPELVQLVLVETDNPHCMFVHCNAKLERVSVKTATYRVFGGESLPISESALIKFVRCTPSLQWFRSDLTAETIQMLKTERPDVVFE